MLLQFVLLLLAQLGDNVFDNWLAVYPHTVVKERPQVYRILSSTEAALDTISNT